jgi:hypothetical protein
MSNAYRPFLVLAVLALVPRAPGATAAPLFALGEDGHTFLYTARPGDSPGHVAELFGVPPGGVDAFLAANDIRDPTRVSPGFVYRVPNPLAKRARTLEEDNVRLVRELKAAKERGRTLLAEAEERGHALARELAEARAGAALAEARAARAARLETLWPLAQGAVGVLLVLATAAGVLTVTVIRRRQQAERYARSLAAELEEKRRGGLLERQESARRILELETRMRTLEAQVGPRVLIGGRG